MEILGWAAVIGFFLVIIYAIATGQYSQIYTKPDWMDHWDSDNDHSSRDD